MSRIDDIKAAIARTEARAASITQRRFRPSDATRGTRRRPSRPRPTQCEACGLVPSDIHGKDQLRYDHNHATGKFRGWLCNNCNTALGMAGDNPEILGALATYLRREGYQSTRELTSSRPLSCRPLSTIQDEVGVRQA